ncbi:hypothetical protein C8J57DRAFT_1518516 [Mycena rebaudengoi]|nr:hypothetical protein C8J57DRAFT_1518516 [Mycena rebaudengoi]
MFNEHKSCVLLRAVKIHLVHRWRRSSGHSRSKRPHPMRELAEERKRKILLSLPSSAARPSVRGIRRGGGLTSVPRDHEPPAPLDNAADWRRHAGSVDDPPLHAARTAHSPPRASSRVIHHAHRCEGTAAVRIVLHHAHHHE